MVSPASASELEAALARLATMSITELRTEWRRLYRANPPKKIGRDMLTLAVSWKLQERALGGLNSSVKRRLADLSQTMEAKGDLAKARLLRLKPGAKLVREWRGETHEVEVLAEGFAWNGKTCRSLSSIAKAITGTHWSGPRFFGLQSKGSVTPIGVDNRGA